ncbi:MAG: integrase [Flavobacteriaceae bacterium]|nr:integrase [Flavobacteriaceae bacterium]|tara:strand:+ start:691 stop:2019 length:1329 start_codon:yes stop_codon:yes gene_type:complete
MHTIYKLVTLECQNEHVLEHDLEHKKQFSEPKIFDADGDLTKRWYVYFSYRNPKSGKLQRMKNIYGKTNGFKTKAERYAALNLYRKRLLKLLREGYSPFQDNTELYKSKQNPKHVQSNILKSDQPTSLVAEVELTKNESTNNVLSVKDALNKAIILKTNIVSPTTLSDYRSRINQFQKWLLNHYGTVDDINQINKKMVVEFLNHVQLSTSPRNRNNYRTVLSSIFQVLEDNEIISKNFISQIKAIRSMPKRHKTYSPKEQEDIFDYLENHDKLLLLYIKFISYNMLRPIEVCRLRVKDIDIEERKLSFQAKNKVLKTKIIPDILIKELPELNRLNPDDLLFTPDGIGGTWDAKLVNRRDYFTKRFKTVVKDQFGYNENYGLYSFRHTFITKLYRELRKELTANEAKSKLMGITGHSSMTALEKYLRDIDAELPEDYSHLLKK